MSDKESASSDHANRVREMFADIAGRYDLLNHLLSGNVDKRWRRLVAKSLRSTLASSDAQVLDVACGTGDLSFTIFETGAGRVVGLDFCRPMLEIANAKASKRGAAVDFIEGDALGLPFGDRSFEAVTIAFGLRNLSSFEAGLKEFLRVLKPGGRLFVLECSKPKGRALGMFYRIYFSKVLPVLGGLVSGSRSAYEYLPDSVARFPDQEALAALMKKAGLEEVSFQNLTGGIAALHIGKRPT